MAGNQHVKDPNSLAERVFALSVGESASLATRYSLGFVRNNEELFDEGARLAQQGKVAVHRTKRRPEAERREFNVERIYTQTQNLDHVVLVLITRTD